ncbi:hypothetical protein MAR_038109 [Mya arenaria]|uniref:CABIT domain-containing protein n=1 Tax=Mya arenaria TaxID=6604 RepID=A0ABY7FQF5_MYAAR|nr:uncharacterized protein LOC128213048 [Mya arenaria]WAR24440.1 hypothetical protein MAR_038109 [Mya arenaria]
MAENEEIGDLISTPPENDELGDLVSTPPSIDWTESVTSFNSFDESSLPQVATFQISEGSGQPALPPGIALYSAQPVLFHTRTRKSHARARTIYHDQEGPYFEVGQTLDIPDDFQGWFEMVPPDFGRGQVFRTIGQLAEAGPRKFFTRTDIRALLIHPKEDENGNKEDDNDTSEPIDKRSSVASTTSAGKNGEGEKRDEGYSERKIPAGRVLEVKGSFAARWQTTTQSGLIKKKSKQYSTIEVPYMKCVDVDGTDVLIPFTTKGRFSVVYEKGIKDSRTVYRMKDILSDLQLPVKVRMVYGKAPVVPCIFTGVLVLKSKVVEDTIIASTILNKRNVLFEIPVSTKCDVRTAVDEEQYETLRTYIDAKMLGKKYAVPFGTLIKLSPELDTDQAMIQHIPTEKLKSRDESLQTLDMITNFSLTDEEPRDYFMESSDTESVQSADASPLGAGQMMELREIELPRVGQIYSDA